MSSEREELIRIFEALPAGKRAEVVDFAKFLLDRQNDEACERTITDPQGRSKLDAFVRTALAEGTGPLDPDGL
jgi:hypothetical protein